MVGGGSATISSEKLEKILEVNAKAIEINTIVSVQYEQIIEKLEQMRAENKCGADEYEAVLDALKEQHKVIISANDDIKKTNLEVVGSLKQIIEVVNHVDRTMFKLSVVLLASSTLISTIATIVAKVIFKF